MSTCTVSGTSIDTRTCMISPGWNTLQEVSNIISGRNAGCLHHFLAGEMTTDSLVSILSWTLPNMPFPIACHNLYPFTVMNWNHEYNNTTDFYETIIYAPEDYLGGLLNHMVIMNLV